MGYMISSDDGWRMPEWLSERMAPLLPAAPFHPLGTHRSRVPDRDAMDAILLVLRTGMQWNALNATGSVRLRRRTVASGHIQESPASDTRTRTRSTGIGPKRRVRTGVPRFRGRSLRVCHRRLAPPR